MKKILLAIPSFLTGGLGLCPACLPLYAGLLGAMGISVADYAAYAPVLISVMLAISLSALFWKAKRRRGYRPLILGVLASVLVITGKFVLSGNMMLGNTIFYAGIVVLIIASLWNIWPKQKTKEQKCEACVS